MEREREREEVKPEEFGCQATLQIHIQGVQIG